MRKLTNLIRRLWLRFIRLLSGKRDPMAVAAEYVAWELISYIAMDQDANGWAHKYRNHFKYDHKAFPTLGDALDELSRETKAR